VADIFVGGFLGKVYQFRLNYSLETGEPCRLDWIDSETVTIGINTLFQCVSFNDQFIMAGRDAKICYTDSRFDILKKIDAHWFSIHALVVSPDVQFLASGSMDKSIRIWDLNSGELLFHKELAHRSSVNKIIWLSENRIVSCSDDAQIISWKIEY
jgi:WD40 repeat protein